MIPYLLNLCNGISKSSCSYPVYRTSFSRKSERDRQADTEREREEGDWIRERKRAKEKQAVQF